MANKKTTELTDLTTVSDVMEIVGVAGTAIKKIALANLSADSSLINA
jgi:hypothetical protein